MLPALFVLFLWAAAELFVAIKVADAIGVLATLLLLVASWPLGSWAMRSQGREVLRRLSVTLAERRAPAREALDGALILLGGALMIVPGFITDVLGALLLLPPTRAIARAGVVRNVRSRWVVRAVRVSAGRQPYDVDSTAADVEPPRLGA